MSHFPWLEWVRRLGGEPPRVDLFLGAPSPRVPGSSFVILSSEGLPRQTVLLIHLGLVVVAAWLCGDLAVRMVTLRLVGPTATPPARLAVAPPRAMRVARQGYQPLVSRNLFGAKVREEVVAGEPEGAGAPSDVPSAPVAKSAKELGLTLVGTVAGPPSVAYAVIVQSGRQELYHVGDEVSSGVVLEEVRHGEVVLWRGAERLLLSMEDENGGGAVSPSRPPTRTSAPKKTETVGIRQVSPNSYLLERETVTASLQNLSTMMRDIRVVPSFDAARQPNGYRVASIRYGSLLDKLGLKRGDIIQSVNGLAISDPDRAYQAYRQLKDESSIQIDILRGSSPQTLTYEIQ